MILDILRQMVVTNTAYNVCCAIRPNRKPRHRVPALYSGDCQTSHDCHASLHCTTTSLMCVHRNLFIALVHPTFHSVVRCDSFPSPARASTPFGNAVSWPISTACSLLALVISFCFSSTLVAALILAGRWKYLHTHPKDGHAFYHGIATTSTINSIHPPERMEN